MANTASTSSGGSTHPKDVVTVARIKGAWGIRGDLKLDVLTDFLERFSPGSVLYLDDAPNRVERSHPIKSGFVVKLDQVNDRTAAEALRGKPLTVGAERVKPLEPGSYYHFQIIGMNVSTDLGECLGEVREILKTGSNDVYVVRGEGRKEVLVPAIRHVVVDVDVSENRMVVRLPEEPG